MLSRLPASGRAARRGDPTIHRLRTWVAALGIGLLHGAAAHAQNLGDARQISRLGEPLKLSIPVLAAVQNPLADLCVAVVPPRQSDGLPHIVTARVALERQGATTALVVTTGTVIREPVLRLLLRAGCDGSTLQYTIFLEPAGSNRQLRAIAQSGPRVPMAGALSGEAPARSEAPPASPVTVIPVVPGGAIPPAAVERRTPPPSGVASSTRSDAFPPPRPPAPPPPVEPKPATATVPVSADEVTAGVPAPSIAETTPRDATASVAIPDGPTTPPVPAETSAKASSPPARSSVMTLTWEAWPLAVALAGLVSLVVGGLLWRRHHGTPPGEWALTGPPSHRMASRTSLAEEPVPFKQVGVTLHEESATPPATAAGQATIATVAPPAPLLLQPSADELGRDLEVELAVAERSHSALERAHPELVERLIQSWGTAAAKSDLSSWLATGSTEISRMSGEAVAELRLLLRVAEDLLHRSRLEPEPGPVASASTG